MADTVIRYGFLTLLVGLIAFFAVSAPGFSSPQSAVFIFQSVAITGILARASVRILDIGQAVIHDTLSFGILVEMTGEGGLSDVLKDVLFRGYELDQQVRFTPTVVVYGPRGERIGEAIVGMRLPDFYALYIEQAIAVAREQLKPQH